MPGVFSHFIIFIRFLYTFAFLIIINIAAVSVVTPDINNISIAINIIWITITVTGIAIMVVMVTAVILGLAAPGGAKPATYKMTTQVPDDVLIPDEVDTRLVKLKLFDGVHTQETAAKV